MKDWYKTYGDPKQILLTNEFQSVYALPKSGDFMDEEGPVELHTQRVDALAIVKVTTFERGTGTEIDSWDEIVGLQLDRGSWEVLNDALNFAGLCRIGDDINSVTDCLAPGLKRRLKTEEAK